MKYLWPKKVVKNPERFEKSLRTYQKSNCQRKQRFGFGKQKSQQYQLRIQRIKRTNHYYRLLSRKKAITIELKKIKTRQQSNREKIESMVNEQQKMDQQIDKELELIKKIQSKIQMQKMHEQNNVYQNIEKNSQKQFEQQVSDNKFTPSIGDEQSTHKITETGNKMKIKIRKDPIEVSPQIIQKMQEEGSIHICSAHFNRRISSRILKKHLRLSGSFSDLLQKISTQHPQFQTSNSKAILELLGKQTEF